MDTAERHGSGAFPNTGLYLLVVALCAFLLFSGSLSYSLVWDDGPMIRYAEKAAEKGTIIGVLSSDYYSGDSEGSWGFYRPLVQWSFLFDMSLYRKGLWNPHLTNVLLHTAVSALVFLLLLRFVSEPLTAFLAAMLFAVHPVHVEAVAFVSARADLWASLFLLAATWLWMKGRRPASASPSTVIASGACLFLACLSKELALVWPAVMVLWWWADAGNVKDTAGSSNWRGYLPWLGAWAVAAGLSLALRFFVAGVPLGVGTERVVQGRLVGAAGDIGLMASVGMTYLGLLAVPWPLNSLYLRQSLPSLTHLVAGTVLAAALLAALGRRFRQVLPAAAWLAAFLVPVAGLVPIPGSIMGERYLYLPSVGFAMLVGLAVSAGGTGRPSRFARAGLSVLVVIFAILSLARLPVWENRISLYSDQAVTSSASSQVTYNLGNALAEAGRREEAVASYQRALAVDPSMLKARINMAYTLAEMGRFGDALNALDRFPADERDRPEVSRARSAVMAAAGRPEPVPGQAPRAAPVTGPPATAGGR